jgi:photosynthetic reaction center cytochrome c subunit
MTHKITSARMLAAVFAIILGATVFAGAQEGQQLAGKTAEQAYKNIQVLKDIPADQVIPTMRVIAGSLGVGCNFCHVQDRSSDEVMNKQTARKMISMMMDINKANFNARQEVTCYTCHKGTNDPVSTLQFSDEPAAPRGGGEGRAQGPSADQIVAKNIEALGGEQAIRSMTSLVITATQAMPGAPGAGAAGGGAAARGGAAAEAGRGGQGGGGRQGGAEAAPAQAQIEEYRKAPNKFVRIVHMPNGRTTAEGFDGAAAWTQDARGKVTELTGIEAARVAREADFYAPLDLSKEYTRLQPRGTAKLDVFAREHDAYVLVGTPQGEPNERLFFDTSTGLRIRKVTVDPTPAGNAPTQTDYDDYRDIGNGIKFPFIISVTNPPDARVTIQVQKVEMAPVDDSKFAKPESKPAQGQ